MKSISTIRSGSEEVASWTSVHLVMDEALMAPHREASTVRSTSVSTSSEVVTPVMRREGILIVRVVCEMVSMSSRGILAGLVSPVGCLERESETAFRTPGMCTIENLKRRVFSFRFLSLPLEICSKERSPNTLRSGLWSTATMRSLHPSTKCRAF